MSRRIAWTGLVVAAAWMAAALTPVPAGLRLPAVLAFACLGPGAAVIAHLRIGEPAVRWATTVVLSLTVFAGLAAGMAFTGWWHPTGVAVASGAAVIAACAMALRRDRPAAMPPLLSRAGPALLSRAGPLSWKRILGHGLVIAATVGLWLVAVARTDLADVGEYGLLASVHPAFLGALALCVAGFVVSLRRDGPAPVGYLLLLILILHGTTPLMLSEPQYAWTYKHVGVVEFFLRHGSVADGNDIYQQWPAFFAGVAFGTDVSNVDPLRLAAGAPVFFNLAGSLVLFAMARTLSPNPRVAYLTVFVFQCVNWVEEDYLSPQGFAFVLGLGAVLVALQRWRGRMVVLAAILAVLAASHQLSPYLVALEIGVLVLLRAIRPWWTVVLALMIPALFLLPRFGLVSGGFQIFDGFNIFQNAAGNAAGWGTSGQALSAVAVRGLALGVWALAGYAALRAWRRGELRRVVVPAALAFAPFVLLAAQSYGGEAIYRVFLFSAPWCAYLIADLAVRVRWARLRVAVPATLLLIVAALATVQGRHGQLMVDRQTQATVEAAEYLYAHATPGSTIVLATPNFPSRLAANYGEFNRGVAVGEPDLVKGAELEHITLNDAYLPLVEEFASSFGGTDTYLVVGDGMRRQAHYFGYLPDGSLDVLDSTLAASADWTVFYRNDDVVIWRATAPRG